ncbi:hypothetical protein LCGC14_1805650, partial [marine sediment metagenome]
MANMNKEIYAQRYEGYKFELKYPILDIGGEDGSFLECVGATSGTVIDMVDDVNKKYNHIVADISKKLPIIKGEFKTIFVTEVLEHLKNPLYVMAQVFDILEDNGKCFISIPYTDFSKRFSLGEWDNGHVSRWKIKEIEDQMKKIGFKIKVIQTRRRFKGLAFWLPHCWIVLE